MVLQAIKYSPGGASSPASLDLLDQLALPHRSTYFTISTCTEAWDAIKQMKVRGAPAIAIVAALSLAVELSRERRRNESGMDRTPESVRDFVWQRLEYLMSSRPTAVNLGDAVGKLKAVVELTQKMDGAVGDTVAVAYITAAEKMLVDDIKDNEAIGKHGAEWIKQHTIAGKRRSRNEGELKVITHCNTG